MKLNVFVFAAVKDRLGTDRLEIDLPEGSKVACLKEKLASQYPQLEDLLDHCAISVDHEYGDDATSLSEGVEIGLIPPVSGG